MSHHLVRGHTLTKSSLKTVAAAVVLSALAATPVFAQAAIQEPGGAHSHSIIPISTC